MGQETIVQVKHLILGTFEVCSRYIWVPAVAQGYSHQPLSLPQVSGGLGREGDGDGDGDGGGGGLGGRVEARQGMCW